MESIFTKCEIEILEKKMLGVLGASFTIDPHEIIGRPYRFECADKHHRYVLFGTVQAIKLSDEGSIDLCVSNSRFWGGHLTSINFHEGKWRVYVGGDNTGPSISFEGKFKLL